MDGTRLNREDVTVLPAAMGGQSYASHWGSPSPPPATDLQRVAPKKVHSDLARKFSEVIFGVFLVSLVLTLTVSISALTTFSNQRPLS